MNDKPTTKSAERQDMNALQQVDWFWSEYRSTRVLEARDTCIDGGFCQCETELIIAASSDPARMRAFLLVAVLLDQTMHANFRMLHQDFEHRFEIPKLFSHLGRGMASPSWFACSVHGLDQLVDWCLVESLLRAFVSAINAWLNARDTNGILRKKYIEHLRAETDYEFQCDDGVRDLLLALLSKCRD